MVVIRIIKNDKLGRGKKGLCESVWSTGNNSEEDLVLRLADRAQVILKCFAWTRREGSGWQRTVVVGPRGRVR